MDVRDLQAWGKCANCGDVKWVEPSTHVIKAARCTCQDLLIVNDVVTGATDGSFTARDLQPLLDEFYGITLKVPDLVDTLQSYAKCNVCGEVLWVEVSEHPQRCGCRCGNLELRDDVIIGVVDAAFGKQDMVAAYEADKEL